MENGSLRREGEKKNLWQSFLSEVSSRSGPPDSFLIFLGKYASYVGNRETGKRDIIQNINSRILKKRPTRKFLLTQPNQSWTTKSQAPITAYLITSSWMLKTQLKWTQVPARWP